MPNAVLRSEHMNTAGNVKIREVIRNVTHNNRRLLTTGGRTYEYVGDDRAGNRIYRDTSKQQ